MLPQEEFNAILENTKRVKKWLIWLFLGAILLTVSSAFGATYGTEAPAFADTPLQMSGPVWIVGWQGATPAKTPGIILKYQPETHSDSLSALGTHAAFLLSTPQPM